MPNLDQERCTTPGLTRRAFIGVTGGAAATALLDPSLLLAKPTLSLLPQGSSHAVFMKHLAYAASAQTQATTIEAYLGAKKSALEELQAHRNDAFYLGTPYGNTGPGEFSSNLDSWDCWHPLGKPKQNGKAYMNCVGFIVAVLEACGANCSKIGTYVAASGYDRGNKANLSRWKNWLDDHAYLRTRYPSKSALLQSGKLRKGDLIIAEPNDWSQPGADNHILFFWGDSPSEDLAWHSAAHGEGIVAGKAPGNMISKITAKFSDCYWLHVPLENLIALTLEKTSANVSVADGVNNQAYSLEGAAFSVFRHKKNGVLSDLITTFITDEKGHASVSLPPGSTVWVREDTPPKGFTAWKEPRSLSIPRNTQNITLKDEPCTASITVVKQDADAGNAPQGHATLKGALFQLEDANGCMHSARTAWNEAQGAWVAAFPNLPRGTAKIREAEASPGYVLTPWEKSDQDGWTTIQLCPNSHEATFAMEPLKHANRVVKGVIEGVKFRESDQEESKTPLERCVFQLWLQDDGSLESKGYAVEDITDAAGKPIEDEDGKPLKGSLLGTMESNADGYFSSAQLAPAAKPLGVSKTGTSEFTLPYGVYTLVESFCPDSSLKLLEPICGLEITSDGQRVHLILEDRLVASPVRIRKTDASSGKLLLKEGTQIELLRKQEDSSFTPVSFDVHYPESQKQSVFTLPSSGVVQFPDRLQHGTYAVREVKPVPPYVLRKELVEFQVEEDRHWDSDEPLEIELPNEAATGRITCMKTHAETSKAVPGATYEIRALEDIQTPDGTQHHSQGDVVATVTTDQDGRWTVEGLSLGSGSARYEVKESESPDGFVRENTGHEVTLSYQDEHTTVVTYELNIKEKTTAATLEKTDALTKEPLEGVVFALCDANDEKAEPLTAKTDQKGKARFTGLACGKTYLFYEQKARTDLGYIRSTERVSRYLDPTGRWHESKAAYEESQGEIEANETKPQGQEEITLRFENEFTKVAVYKVDQDLWNSLDAQSSDTAAKTLEQKSLLNGGRFRLLDEKGNALEVTINGKRCASWSASDKEPVILTHLQPGKRYSIEEMEAPEGYQKSTSRTEFSVSNTVESQVVVIGNRKLSRLPATSDLASRIIPATAAVLTTAAGVALLSYTKRRTALETSWHEQANATGGQELDG